MGSSYRICDGCGFTLWSWVDERQQDYVIMKVEGKEKGYHRLCVPGAIKLPERRKIYERSKTP